MIRPYLVRGLASKPSTTSLASLLQESTAGKKLEEWSAASFLPHIGRNERKSLNERRFNFQTRSGDPHALHVICSSNNTKLTFSHIPSGKVKLRTSGGIVGFKHTQRGGFEAGYRAASVMFERINERIEAPKEADRSRISEMEVVFQGFGMGREAFAKALTGLEGKHIRNYVQRVTDATKLKFGGCRGRKVRRL